MKLNEAKVRYAKPQDKDYKLSDGRGMYMLVKTNGSKYWRLNYRFRGKAKTLALGVYPDASLKKARARRDEARTQLDDGIDPAAAKQAAKLADNKADTFEAVAREWFQQHSPGWAANHASKVIRRLEKDIFPWVGDKPMDAIDPPELLKALRRIQARGALETAHRAKATCGQVFRYGIATGRATRDPAADLRGALPPVKPTHFASVTDPREIGNLLRVIDGYRGDHITRYALKLAPLVFVRPGELRGAEWSEIDLEAAEWRIPAARMKMNAVHIVPLSKQAVAILRDMQPATGGGRFVFPGARSSQRCMSENTITAALRRMGYSGKEMTGHGFRSMASTRLNEMGWKPDVIERQLAHAERDPIRAAYNYAEHLPERRKMMQAWADYLDGLKGGADVVPIRANASA
ncbi:MAG TPA: integrase arm-type DNA-binding domain-containing protein [Gammaproteobacteria bacterium]|nr:integrase arm-type DNA-binding domain-containing protein [Gammaproteobacteria bacterium]